jgi:hypothetical protein
MISSTYLLPCATCPALLQLFSNKRWRLSLSACVAWRRLARELSERSIKIVFNVNSDPPTANISKMGAANRKPKSFRRASERAVGLSANGAGCDS